MSHTTDTTDDTGDGLVKVTIGAPGHRLFSCGAQLSLPLYNDHTRREYRASTGYRTNVSKEAALGSFVLFLKSKYPSYAIESVACMEIPAEHQPAGNLHADMLVAANNLLDLIIANRGNGPLEFVSLHQCSLQDGSPLSNAIEILRTIVNTAIAEQLGTRTGS